VYKQRNLWYAGEELEVYMAKRRQHSGQEKARVVIQAIEGHKTVNQIAGEHKIHPTLVTRWKAEALERLPEIMSDSRGPSRVTQEHREARMLQQIGHLTMEVEFLKKKLGLCHLETDEA
jgi:transposase-like protein